jgi:hypothetical protein
MDERPITSRRAASGLPLALPSLAVSARADHWVPISSLARRSASAPSPLHTRSDGLRESETRRRRRAPHEGREHLRRWSRRWTEGERCAPLGHENRVCFACGTRDRAGIVASPTPTRQGIDLLAHPSLRCGREGSHPSGAMKSDSQTGRLSRMEQVAQPTWGRTPFARTPPLLDGATLLERAGSDRTIREAPF